MNSEAVVLKLKVMDGSKNVLEELPNFPAVEIDDLIFLRVAQSDMHLIQGQIQKLSMASGLSGKTIIILPEKAEVLEIEKKWGKFSYSQVAPSELKEKEENN